MDEFTHRPDLHEARLRLEEVERTWRNLNQTVPPHAQDWWDHNMAGQKERMLDARAAFDRAAKEGAPLPDSFSTELSELERLCEVAKVKLGERTAAGRAKAG